MDHIKSVERREIFHPKRFANRSAVAINFALEEISRLNFNDQEYINFAIGIFTAASSSVIPA